MWTFCGNAQFSTENLRFEKNFRTRKLGEISVFCSVITEWSDFLNSGFKLNVHETFQTSFESLMHVQFASFVQSRKLFSPSSKCVCCFTPRSYFWWKLCKHYEKIRITVKWIVNCQSFFLHRSFRTLSNICYGTFLQKQLLYKCSHLKIFCKKAVLRNKCAALFETTLKFEAYLGPCQIFIWCMTFTAWKVSVFGVILVCIFPHSDWILRDTPYPRIRTLFTLRRSSII